MAKPAKPKADNTGRKSRNSKHGRTFCKRCLKKISAGRSFCNNTCRDLYMNGVKPQT